MGFKWCNEPGHRHFDSEKGCPLCKQENKHEMIGLVFLVGLGFVSGIAVGFLLCYYVVT